MFAKKVELEPSPVFISANVRLTVIGSVKVVSYTLIANLIVASMVEALESLQLSIPDSRGLDHLLRYESRLERSFDRTLTQFERAQRTRKVLNNRQPFRTSKRGTEGHLGTCLPYPSNDRNKVS